MTWVFILIRPVWTLKLILCCLSLWQVMTEAETSLVSNPGTMFLLVEEKVQALAREKSSLCRNEAVLVAVSTNVKLLNPWIGITSKALWVLQKIMQAICILQILIQRAGWCFKIMTHVRTVGKENVDLIELKLEMIHGTEKGVITLKKVICFHT